MNPLTIGELLNILVVLDVQHVICVMCFIEDKLYNEGELE